MEVHSKESNYRKIHMMEETLQRLSVGIFGFIAVESMEYVNLLMEIASRGVVITLTVLSIYKMWKELKK
jgi:hypothetical protein